MEIRHEEKGKKGEFFIEEEGERLAKVQYFASAEGQISVYHTEVDPKFRGEGIGEDLVAAVARFALKNNLKIDPTCPYARKIIEETPEFAPVLADK